MDTVVPYLDSLFTKLETLRSGSIPGLTPATTPLIGLATGGMRGRAGSGDNGYAPLIATIRTYFDGTIVLPGGAAQLAVGPPSFDANHRSFAVATGNQEAIYGWITANYSMGRLEGAVPPPSYGFLEMGGQSVQIAYQVRPEDAAGCPQVTIDFNLPRVFPVFTKMISGLGTMSARAKYFETALPQVHGIPYDRCSIQDQELTANARGSGLCIPPAKLKINHTAAQRIERLNESLPSVQTVVTAAVPEPLLAVLERILLQGAPVVLANDMHFVGGSSFWHANKSLYLHNVNPTNSFNFAELNRLICRFACKRWLSHFGEVVEHATAIVQGMDNAAVREKVNTGDITEDRATLRGKTFKKWEGFRRNTLFCAMLVHSVLYKGIGLLPDAQFQPFNGVVGLYDGKPNENVPYSWTLGRALLEVTRDVGGVQVRSPLPLSPCLFVDTLLTITRI